MSDMSFLEHLGELRKRVLYSFLSVFVVFLVAWNFADKFAHWISLPLLKHMEEGSQLAFTSLADPFLMYIKLSAVAAIFGAAPFIFYQLWLFISPALYTREKRYFLPFIFFSSLFFLAGGSFGYLVALPFTCEFFLQVGQNYNAIITVNEYTAFAFRILLGTALIFEMPVLVFLLSRIGLVTHTFLIKYFKYAVVLIFVIAAVITPTPDIITQSVFAAPMILLYMLSIGIARMAARKKEVEEEEEE